jgi:hypothetical protein
MSVKPFGLPFCEAVVVVVGGIGSCVRGGVVPEGVFTLGGGLSLHAAASRSRHAKAPATINRRTRFVSLNKTNRIFGNSVRL